MYLHNQKQTVMHTLNLFPVFLISINFSFATAIQTELKSGFSAVEAKEMIQLCNSYTYIELYGSDEGIIPKGYVKIYTSPVVGMDNVFQIYIRGKIGVINFRGSTDKKSSWLENIHSSIIPAEGEIETTGGLFEYKFSENSSAGVHSGFALGLAYLEKDILTQIRLLNDKGIYNIILTGHSQGGSLAILTRSHLAHLGGRRISKKNSFKVYAFAQPMVGNQEFVIEYDRNFTEEGMSFSIVNLNDMVPEMPLSFNDSTYWRSNLGDLLSRDRKLNTTKMIKDGLSTIFKGGMTGVVAGYGRSVDKQIEKQLGKIKLPIPMREINYSKVGNVISIPPPEYPLELKDSSWLNNEAFLRDNPRDSDGVFENRSLYKKATIAQNHKPYNYYTAILKKYFPEDYDVIEPKLFVEEEK